MSQFKKRKTYSLRLTKLELLHLRDLFSVTLPPDLNRTISQGLAELEQRMLVETKLWNKVVAACQDAELPIDDEAPDYIIAPTGSPALSVFQLASEPDGEQEDSETETGLPFIKGSEEEGE